MIRYVITLLLVSTCGSFAAPLSTQKESLVNTLFTPLVKTCHNSFLAEQINKALEYCDVLPSYNQRQVRCVMFYDINQRLCDAVVKSKLALPTDTTKITESLTVTAACELAKTWSISNITKLPHYKKNLDQVLRSISCTQVCGNDDITKLEANYYCKYFKWGLDVLQPASVVVTPTGPDSSSHSGALDALGNSIASAGQQENASPEEQQESTGTSPNQLKNPDEGQQEDPFTGQLGNPIDGAQENPPAGQHENPPAGQDENPPAGQDNNPPAGQHKIPPAGQHENPPAGQHENPPAGQDENPPAGQDNNPPAGQHKNPPAGQHENPPAGQHKNPPAGQHENPPAGQHQNPPAGQHENPPAGQHENPPAGQHENPPAGQHEKKQDHNNIGNPQGDKKKLTGKKPHGENAADPNNGSSPPIDKSETDMGPDEYDNDPDNPEGFVEPDTGDTGKAFKMDKSTHRESQNPFPVTDFTGEDDHFFSFFLTGIIMVVLIYVLYHNKNKVSKVFLGLIVEGRQSGRRRNSRGHAYRRLDTLEQAMSTNSATPPSKIIY